MEWECGCNSKTKIEMAFFTSRLIFIANRCLTAHTYLIITTIFFSSNLTVRRYTMII